MARRVKARGQWKPVEFDVKLFNEKELQHLICVEELTDYEVLGEGYRDVSKENGVVYGQEKSRHEMVNNKKGRQRIPESALDKKLCARPNGEQIDNSERISGKMKKADKDKMATKHALDATDLMKSTDGLNLRKRIADAVETTAEKNIVKKKKLDTTTNIDQREKLKNPVADMTAWSGLFVPDTVLKSLSELGFASPTLIQSLTLPSAIRDKLDIVGAAETGSGKTLSFAIPVVHHILRDKEFERARRDKKELEHNKRKKNQVEVTEESMEEDAVDNEVESDGSEEEDNRNSDNCSTEEDSSINNESGSGDDDDDDDSGEDDNKLRALVLSPTRELAIQVRDHILAITKYTDIQCVAIVGGMSVQKQTRLLKKRPEIVVATPGRLWELIHQGNDHLSGGVASIRYLVIDEADRMVEKGHFQELANILQLVNNDESLRSQRQTFVFSATLTFVHVKPAWLNLKKKKKKKVHQITSDEKLGELIGRIGFRGKPKVIDLTERCEQGTVSTLSEARINCSMEDKDAYLYYFLCRYPGRTLVFSNSKDCVRRLVSVFTLLKCSPLPLHADMHQRQRLKNLDRFRDNVHGLLLATDVAARGLDIPDIQHVIHYQVPQTTENYIHRSGRTARAQKDGLSVMLIGPDDVRNYSKIIKSLKREDDLPVFPTEVETLSEIKGRVSVARQLDLLEHRLIKKKKQMSWFEQAAKEADIILDDDNFDEDDREESQERATEKRQLDNLHRRLAELLARPIGSCRQSTKYPTKTGKLKQPSEAHTQEGGAVRVVQNETRKKLKNAVENSKNNNTNSSDEQKIRKKRRKFYGSRDSSHATNSTD